MGASRSIRFRLAVVVLTALLLSPFAGGTDVSLGFGPPDTTSLRSASEGGRGFSPELRSAGRVDVRELSAQGPTAAQLDAAVPFLQLPSQATASPSAPSAEIYTGPAPVHATITANPAAALPGFLGLSYASGPATSFDPPDPWVAVGPDDVVQAVNTSLRFTDRSGNSPVSISLGSFFGTGGRPVADPRVIYDSLHARWIATAFFWDCDAGDGASFGHGYLAIGISDTSDPLGTWSGVFFVYADYLPDFPAPGTSSDKVAVTANVFAMTPSANCLSGAGYVGADIIVMDWAAVLSTTDPPFDYYVTGTDYFTPRVAVQTPATSAPLRMVVQKDVSGSLDVAYGTFTGLVGPGGGTALSEVDLTAGNVIQDFFDPIAPRQPSGTVTTQIDSRPTDAVWQNNLLTFVSTQACTPAGDTQARDCVRVSQLDTTTATPSLAQDFLIAQTGADSYFGGLGQSANGGLFVVWTRSSGTAGAYPSSYGAYQLPTDAPNSISPPELLAAGQANHIGGRWGDYVGVAQDPQDQNAVWQGNQFSSSDGRWGTLISQLETATAGATYGPLTPARLLDTRNGTGLSGTFSAMVPRTFQVAGLGGVPIGAVGVTGNLTATNQSNAGFVFLGPDPLANPSSSTLNFPAGDTRANGVTVALSPSGTLSATFGYSGTTDLIFDVTGYFVADASGATYVPLSPARLLDTRNGTGLSGKFSAGVPRTFQVAGLGGVPVGAVGVTGNLTVTNQSNAGFVFLGPITVSDPGTSTLNFPAGDTRANGVTVALSLDGTLSATFGYSGTTDLIFDVTGYFVANASGATYVPLSPARLLDTRNGTGLSGKFSAMVPRTFQVTGLGGVPAGVVGVTGNLTVTNQSNAGFVFLGPDPLANPSSSTLNFPAGDTRANGVTVAVSLSGTLSATFGYSGTTDLIFDVTGYFVE